MHEIDYPTNPFPGLRAFESSETHLFFGRDGQSEELLRRLKRTRFLAVVGTSGSGKSSLVRAGLLPALQGGLMASAGSDWRIAILRPGSDPIGNLARALASPAVLGAGDEKSAPMQVVLAETTLRRSSLGLVDLVTRARTKVTESGQPLFADYENLLVVVDQFEELFRFKQLIEEENSQEDAACFVRLLLEAVRQNEEKKIYVVLTMRSDFLGDCAQFFELPEAINKGQYLIPRMTRDERRAAISGPVAVGQGTISEPLVNQLLNDVGDNPDQLPILQHALMRTWDHWLGHRNGNPIDIRDYDAIGGMAAALSRHADEAYAELNDAQQAIAEKLFKGLTEKGADNREIRRPMEVQEICALTGADEATVIPVVEVFRREGRSFLMPPPTDPLTGAAVHLNGESLIDISHESLIRNWERLKSWADEESRSARIYRRLAETAVLNKEGGAGLWRDPDLGVALTWREQSNPNLIWAKRYHPEFPLAMSFLDASVAARDAQIAGEEARRRIEIKRTRITASIFGVAFILSLVLGIYALFQRNRVQQSLQSLREYSQQVLEESAKSRHLLYTADVNLAGQAFANKNIVRGLELLEAHLPGSELGEVPGFEWYYFWHRYHQERATLRGHTDSLSSVAFSPDGRTLATGSFDTTIKLWDTALQRELATLKGHTTRVYCVAFSPDSKTLASGGGDGTVKLWDVTSHQELATLSGHSPWVTSIAFSPDGRTLATGSTDTTVRLWDYTSHLELATLTAPGFVNAVAFSPDGRTLVVGSDNEKVVLWDTASHRVLAELKGRPPVYSVAFSPDGRTLATGSDDTTVTLWDTRSRKEVSTLKGDAGPIASVAFSPDGSTLATASVEGAVKLWDTGSHRELATLSGHGGAVSSVAFSPDGRTLATGGDDNSVKLWNSTRQRESDTLNGYARRVDSMAFSADGRTLVTGGTAVKLWDTVSRREITTLGGGEGTFYSIAVSPDGETLAISDQDRNLRLWNIASRREIATLKEHTGETSSTNIYPVAFSPDGRTVAAGGDDCAVTLWDTTSHQEVATFIRPMDDPNRDPPMVTSMAFSPDGRTLAVGDDEKTVTLWDTASHQQLDRLTGHTYGVNSVAFSTDGKKLATASNDRTVKLWDTASHRELVTLKGHTADVTSVAFSPDGTTLATSSADATVKLWDTFSYKELTTLKGHGQPVSFVKFSPEGRTLVTAGEDGTVRLWRGATDTEVAAQRKSLQSTGRSPS